MKNKTIIKFFIKVLIFISIELISSCQKNYLLAAYKNKPHLEGYASIKFNFILPGSFLYSQELIFLFQEYHKSSVALKLPFWGGLKGQN